MVLEAEAESPTLEEQVEAQKTALEARSGAAKSPTLQEDAEAEEHDSSLSSPATLLGVAFHGATSDARGSSRRSRRQDGPNPVLPTGLLSVGRRLQQFIGQREDQQVWTLRLRRRLG